MSRNPTKYATFSNEISNKNRTSITKSKKNEIIGKQKNKCYYCGIIMPSTIHIHHRKSLSNTEKTLGNIIAVCPNCNFDINHRQKLRKMNKKKKQSNRKFRGLYTPPRI